LNKLGFETFGLDISKNSIEYARAFANDKLHFDIHDMREVYREEHFDYVLNLFTSFGYFENSQDLLRTMKAIHAELKTAGTLVIDYLNVNKVEADLRNGVREKIVKDDIEFAIEKHIRNGFVEKQISFQHKRGRHQYTERVAAIDLSNFEDLLKRSGFILQTIAGDYQFNAYDKEISPRLILVASKS